MDRWIARSGSFGRTCCGNVDHPRSTPDGPAADEHHDSNRNQDPAQPVGGWIGTNGQTVGTHPLDHEAHGSIEYAVDPDCVALAPESMFRHRPYQHYQHDSDKHIADRLVEKRRLKSRVAGIVFRTMDGIDLDRPRV